MFTSALLNPPLFHKLPLSHCMSLQSLDLTTEPSGTNQRLLRSSESCKLQHGSLAKPTTWPMWSIQDLEAFRRHRSRGVTGCSASTNGPTGARPRGKGLDAVQHTSHMSCGQIGDPQATPLSASRH